MMGSCLVQLSPPLKLSPRSLSGGAVHRSSPAVSRPPGGGGTPIDYLYRYVPPKGVVILKLLI